MKIIFFGTPEFAASILQDLVKANIDIVAIVTRPDMPQGRAQQIQPPPVKKLAMTLLPQVPILQFVKCSTPENIEILKSFQADLFVVVAYGEILSQPLLDLPPFGCVNVHPSLLPLYRGAAPMQRALMNGETETGVCIIRLVKKMDAGDILHMKKMQIPLKMHIQELEQALVKLGLQSLLAVIHDFDIESVTAIAQDESRVTFAHKITTADCRIDWRKPAHEVYNLIRAVSDHPGAWCDMEVRGQKKRLKVFRAELLSHLQAPAGTILQEQKLDCIVACQTGGAIRLLTLQLEGKPIMSASDFMKGYPDLSSLKFI